MKADYMANINQLHDKLWRAELELESSAFYSKVCLDNPGANETARNYLRRRQREAIGMGAAVLKIVLNDSKVKLVMGEHPLTVPDPLAWLERNDWYSKKETLTGHFTDTAAVVTDFNTPKWTLKPQTTFTIESALDLDVPGVYARQPYFGNRGSDIFIHAADLAVALFNSARLVLPASPPCAPTS